MEPLWTTNPSVLVEPPYMFKVFPMQDMTATEKSNATARLVGLVALGLYFRFPTQRYWMYAAAVFVYLFFSNNTPEKWAETFSYDTVKGQTAQQFAKIGEDLSDKPKTPAEERVSRTSRIKELQQKAARGAKVKEKYLKDLFDDKDRKVLTFMQDSRETSPRGEVVWSKAQQIYCTRPYVRPSTDEYDDLFNADTGPYKFLSRKA